MKMVALVVVTSAVFAAAGRAQTPTSGTRVRVTAASLRLDRRTGSVESTSRDSIAIRFEDRSFAIWRGAIDRLEVSVGERRGSPVVGGLLGGAAGIGLVILGLAVLPSDPCAVSDCDSFGPEVLAIPAVVIGGAIGGAFYFHSRKHEAWRTVDPRLADGGGFQLGVRFSLRSGRH